MPTFLYKCPVVGYLVQGVADDGQSKPAADYFQAVECTACGMVHFVSPETGKVLGEKDE